MKRYALIFTLYNFYIHFIPEEACHENAARHLINGTTECFCKQGYYGNGKNCTGMLKIETF